MMEDLLQELRLLEGDWDSYDRYYADVFLPAFLPEFCKKPLNNAPPEMAAWRPDALVSILGFSWQPVVLMAAWARPRYLLILGTAKSLEANRANIETYLREYSVEPRTLDVRTVDDHAEINIYRETKRFIETHNLDPREVLIDPTGGKKSMSAAAALAGFISHARIGYVEAEYASKLRRPKPGTEYPRLIDNPLKEFGDIEIGKVCEAFDQGRFVEAQRRSEELAAALYAPREAEFYAALASTYGAWDRFNFEVAARDLDRALDILTRHGRRPELQRFVSLTARLENHRAIVSRLVNSVAGVHAMKRETGRDRPRTFDEGMELVLNHLAFALRQLQRGELTLSVMLLYSTVERYVDTWLTVEHGLDLEDPDYSGVSLNTERYNVFGKKLFGDRFRSQEPNGSITYSTGLLLLGSLRDELFDGLPVREFSNLANLRNRCEFEHGFVPPTLTASAVEHSLDVVKQLVARCTFFDQLDAKLDEFRFPMLCR